MRFRISSQSRHSPRKVRTNRSAIPFALGARTGVLITHRRSLRNSSSSELPEPIRLSARSCTATVTGHAPTAERRAARDKLLVDVAASMRACAPQTRDGAATAISLALSDTALTTARAAEVRFGQRPFGRWLLGL